MFHLLIPLDLPKEVSKCLKIVLCPLKMRHMRAHFIGGYISLWPAAHHPKVVARLVLVASVVIPQVKTISGYFVPLFTAIRYTPPEFLPILSYDALRAGPLTLLRAVCSLIALNSTRGDCRRDRSYSAALGRERYTGPAFAGTRSPEGDVPRAPRRPAKGHPRLYV